jgi:hypothetical protein
MLRQITKALKLNHNQVAIVWIDKNHLIHCNFKLIGLIIFLLASFLLIFGVIKLKLLKE